MNYTNKNCEYCNVTISYKNWSHHVKTKKHARLAPSVEQVKKKDLNRLAKDLNMRGVSGLKKEELQKKINRLKEVRFSESELRKKTVKDLWKLAREHNIRVPVKYRKAQVIDAILRQSHANELSFSDDIIEPSRVRKKENKIVEVETAFKGRLKTYLITNKRGELDVSSFLDSCKELVQSKIAEQKQNLKINLVLLADFQKGIGINKEYLEKNFKTENEIILTNSNIDEFYSNACRKIMREMEEFEAKGSNWSLRRIKSLQLNVNKYVPFRGSSYMELPNVIKKKRAIINVRNEDNKCFLWSILSALYTPNDHADRVSNYKEHEHEFDQAFKGLEFPFRLVDIPKFERISGVSINVYGYDDENKCVHPLHVTKDKQTRHVNLFYIQDEQNSHYCWIKNMSALVRAQMTKDTYKIFICDRCLGKFTSEERLKKHEEDCSRHQAVNIRVPLEGKNTLKFKDYNNSMRVPYVIYADFECLLKRRKEDLYRIAQGLGIDPIGKARENLIKEICELSGVNYELDESKPFTVKYQKHTPVSFCYYIKSAHDGHYNHLFDYVGEDASRVFVTMMELESIYIKKIYERVVPMKDLTDSEQEQYDNETNCHICQCPLYGVKVRDHDHLTGKFRGAAHSNCNLNYNNPSFIPVFIHNLAGYDTHLFIKEFGFVEEQINVIPNNEERYISFSATIKGGITLRFLDSFKFLSKSVDGLAKITPKNMFRETSKFFTGDQLDLLTRKGVYPYDYMDSIEKMDETTLPGRHFFYNRLNKESVNTEEYRHACNVWKTFECESMRDYTQLYNKSDVLILADVMENFRDECLKTYGLDPAWYYTLPGLSWSAMLKMTKMELELLTDYDMIMMIEKGIRGGISQCCHRYGKANNKYLVDYNPEVKTSYLTYLDANNLYGWAMSQYMPYGDFKWSSTDIDVTTIPDDSNTGYILEVDLEYPQQLHDKHRDLPLAPEHRVPPGSKEAKLLTTLFDKDRYVIHYRNLKLYLSLGMKLKTIHRVVSFSQSDWLKKYIDLNTELRMKATNDFGKDLYKLMNNSVFGKTMENIRNRVDIRLCTKDKQIDKLVAKPNFKSRTIFTENLSAVHMAKTKLWYNKPIYIGMSILDVSKYLMYDFHYNTMKVKYDDNIRLLYTDTDSLIYMIETEDFYKDMAELIDYFDTSDYAENNVYGLPRVNKKVLGKMKDELCGVVMREMIGLRSKMYATDVEEQKNLAVKKSKGVKKSVVQNEITFDDYKRCLFEKTEVMKCMNSIRSYGHDLYSIEMRKKALSSKDDKRCIQEDGISSLPWGHYSISIE